MNYTGQGPPRKLQKHDDDFLQLNDQLNDSIVAKATSILGQFLNREDAKLTKVQIDTITSVMDGKNTFVVDGVGSGKSFMYLIPSILMLQQHQRLQIKDKALAIVLSPLISLISDQVIQYGPGAKSLGIALCALTSLTKEIEKARIMRELENGTIGILYVSPEMFVSLLQFILLHRKVVMVAVDEAHTFVTFGHNFRPAFLHLPRAFAALSNPVVLLLTGTATLPMIEDITKAFNISKSVLSYTPRLNIVQEMVKVDGMSVMEVEKSKLEIIRQCAKIRKYGPGIVVVSFKKEADNIARQGNEFYSKSDGMQFYSYHAGHTADEKEAVMGKLMATGVHSGVVVVCTIYTIYS